MSCIYPNLQSFIHVKEWDVVYTQDSEGKSSREKKEGEKPLNRQYFPQMENVGDILSPWSIWLGECFIWTGRLSGKAWCYDLLKVQREGNYNVVGNGTYVCMCLQLYVDEYILAHVTASLKKEGKDSSVRWWAVHNISVPWCTLLFLFYDIL